MLSNGSTALRKTTAFQFTGQWAGLTWSVMFLAALPCSGQETVAKPVKNVPEKSVENPAVKTEAKPEQADSTEAKPTATPSVPLTGVTFVKSGNKPPEANVEIPAD